MNWPSAQLVLGVLGWLVSIGFFAWFQQARKLTSYADLDKRYVKTEDFNRDLNGFRNAMHAEQAEINRRVDGSEAASRLAVQNADNALAKCAELAQTLREVHERELGRLAKTMEDQARKLDSIQNQGIVHNTLLRALLEGQPVPRTMKDE